MGNAIFVSDASGYGIYHNPQDKERTPATFDGTTYAAGKEIVRFSQFTVYDEQRGEKVSKGYLVLNENTDKERLKFLRSYRANRLDYREVTALPEYANVSGSVVIGGNDKQNTEEGHEAVRVAKHEIVEKTTRCLDLKRKLFKEDGKIKQNALEAELNEYKLLADELGL